MEYFSSFAPTSTLQSATANVFNTSNSNFVEGQGLENNGGNLVVADMPYNTSVANPVQLPAQFTGMPTAAPAAATITAMSAVVTGVAPNQITTVTVTAANSLQVGQAVDITGVTTSGYNGVWNVVTASGTQFTYQVSGALSTTITLSGAKATPGPLALPGLPGADTNSNPYDVYFTHEAAGPAGNNVMYITDSNGFANGTITKWSLVSGSWVLNDTIAAPTSSTTYYWLTGTTDGSGNVTLYATFSTGGNSNTGPGYIFQISDTGGYNAAVPNHTATTIAAVGSGATLGTSTTTNEVFKGIAVFTVAAVPVTNVVVNSDYIPISAASVSGTTVTLTSEGNSGFTVGNSITVGGFTGAAAGDNGTFTITGVTVNATTDSITYTDINGGTGASTNNTAAYAVSLNTTSSLSPGGPTGHQRSVVDSIAYTFSQPVALTAANFTVGLQPNITVSTLSGGTTTNTTFGIVPAVNVVSPDGGFTWVVFFTNTGNTASTAPPITDRSAMARIASRSHLLRWRHGRQMSSGACLATIGPPRTYPTRIWATSIRRFLAARPHTRRFLISTATVAGLTTPTLATSTVASVLN